MPKKTFATPDQEKEWKEHVKEYNRQYKQRPEYQEYITEFKASPDYKKRQRKYQSKRWRSKRFKKVRQSPEYKAKQKAHQQKFYSDPKNAEARKVWEADYRNRQEVKDKRNAAKRAKRAKDKQEREELLAAMTTRERNAFLAREKKVSDKKTKAKKVKQAFQQLEAAQAEAERIIIEKQKRDAEKITRQAFRESIDKAIGKIINQRKEKLKRQALEYIPYTQRVLQAIIDYHEMVEDALNLKKAA